MEGKVRRPREWTWSQLKEMEQESRTVTLECAENLPGGSLVGNAQWRGVLLARLLEEAGVEADAQEVVLEGADRGLDELEMVPVTYARSLPLDETLAAGTLVALEMNGQPLTPEHGFPARAIVPGWYGMAARQVAHARPGSLRSRTGDFTWPSATSRPGAIPTPENRS